MAQFASDAFTGSAGTALNSYSANWVKHTSSGTGTIIVMTGNKIRHGADNEGLYYHTGTPAGANYTVSLSVTNPSGGFGNLGQIARADTGANTFYLCRWESVSGQWQLYKRVSGTFTLLGTYTQALTAGVAYLSVLRVNGTTIEVDIDGVNRISVTDSAISSAGKSGLRSNTGGASDTNTMQADDFSADDIGSAGGVGPIIKHFRLINGGILMQSRLVIRSMLRWLRGGSFA